MNIHKRVGGIRFGGARFGAGALGGAMPVNLHTHPARGRDKIFSIRVDVTLLATPSAVP